MTEWLSTRKEDVVDIDGLCTRLDRCLSVVPGPVDPALLSTLTEHGYDQAPVYDRTSHHYWGLAETSYLCVLVDAGQPLRSDDPHVCDSEHDFHVGPAVTIFGLLSKMAERRAVVVINGPDVTEGGEGVTITGLLTISDLNRHAVRGAIYHLLANVESSLAKCLEGLVPNPWAWLEHLDEEQQARVLGYWELSRRQGVDVGPVAALTLAQLINVIAKHDDLSDRLGYRSRSNFSKATGRLARLRNRVMHPVRPLILAHADVGEVQRAVLVLAELRDRTGVLVEKL